VVPKLDRIADFVVSVFDGRWPLEFQAQPLQAWLARA
jgi:hypothetical protein